MKSLKIAAGPIILEVGPRKLVLAARNARFAGRHATLFFEATDDALTPHVTQPGKHWWRDWLPEIPLASLRAVLEAIQRDVLTHWVASLVATTPESLEADDWLLIVPDDERVGGVIRRHTDKGVLKVNATLMNELQRLAVDSLDSVLRLPEFVGLKRPLNLARFNNRCVEECSVAFYPGGLPDGRAPGWYSISAEWLSNAKMRELLTKYPGPRLWEALLKINRLLGIGDRQEIEGLLEMARKYQQADAASVPGADA